MNIEDLKNSICLESYTSSPGYYGYFYYIGDKIRHGGEIAISILDSLVRNEIEFGVSAISSLTLSCDISDLKPLYEYSDSDVKEFIEPLLSSPYSIVDGDGFRNVPITEGNINLLYKAYYIQMTLGGLCGHIFIYLERLGLFIYPHDDVGLGFISTKENPSVNIFDTVDRELFNAQVLDQRNHNQQGQ